MQYVAILELAMKVLKWLEEHGVSLQDLWPKIEAFLADKLDVIKDPVATPDPTPTPTPTPGPTMPVPAEAKLTRQIAGTIPNPRTNDGAMGTDGKYVGEEMSVPLTGVPPESNAMPGFLWKPIGSALGTVSIYAPLELAGKVLNIHVVSTNGVVLWSSVDGGTPGDDGRPFWRTAIQRNKTPTSAVWVRFFVENGAVLWYPIADVMLRNGCGHGNTPPHLYPFVQLQIQTVPVTPPAASTLTPAPATPFHALMATDWGACNDLKDAYGAHVWTWKEAGIDTIYVVGDLRVGDGSRPHIVRCRTHDAPTAQFIANLQQIRRWGFRVIVAAYNEPSVRSGGSQYLGAFRDYQIGDAGEMYEPFRLRWEHAYWKELLASFIPDAIVLVLEPSHPSAKLWQKDLAEDLRTTLGYTGFIYANGYGDGEWQGGLHDVRWAPSTHEPSRQGTAHILNMDGATGLNAGNAPAWVPEICRTSAPDGWILWYDEYRGLGGPSGLEDWMWQHIAK